MIYKRIWQEKYKTIFHCHCIGIRILGGVRDIIWNDELKEKEVD
jgi:hypothetical protein